MKELVEDYEQWMHEHPSALSNFKSITLAATRKRIALFLDYDGTLSPIVSDPDRAFMAAEMRSALKDVAKYFPTSIISGRSRAKVQQFVGLPELYYAGSHGMDIVGPVRSDDQQGSELYQPEAASELITIINEAVTSLVERTKDITGATVENNKFCISVHYRNVDKQSWGAVAQCVDDFISTCPHLKLTLGLKVFELRPVIQWNKGNAVMHLLGSLGLEGCEDVLPIYIGDDRTDEDAFKVLKERNLGFGILVSSVPKPSEASYSLTDPSEVLIFLESLVIWKEESTM